MELVVFGIIPVLILILANGFFSASELAILSVRKSTIARLLQEGNRQAQAVDQLQKDSHRFLATVQIGVTVVGSMASAIAGATAVEYLQPLLYSLPNPFVRHYAEPLSLAVVIAVVSYLTLVLGELAPKTIGLQYADRVALAVARTLDLLSGVAVVLVKFLAWSNRSVLALLRIKPELGRAFITRDEVLHAVTEGREVGALTELEHKVIGNMLDFTRTATREVMTPRPRVVGLDVNMSREQMMAVIREHMYSRYPVYSGSIENILGFIHSKDLLDACLPTVPAPGIRNVLRPPLYVPESKSAADLLREMQRRKVHMALVVDEYGGISGLVTSEDLLEELVGEIEDEHDAGELRRAERQPDGSMLVDGLVSLNDLKELLGIQVPEAAPYDTLAGMILHVLGRFPQPGERLVWRGYTLTCIDVTPTAIVKVAIAKEPSTVPD